MPINEIETFNSKEISQKLQLSRYQANRLLSQIGGRIGNKKFVSHDKLKEYLDASQNYSKNEIEIILGKKP